VSRSSASAHATNSCPFCPAQRLRAARLQSTKNPTFLAIAQFNTRALYYLTPKHTLHCSKSLEHATPQACAGGQQHTSATVQAANQNCRHPHLSSQGRLITTRAKTTAARADRQPTSINRPGFSKTRASLRFLGLRRRNLTHLRTGLL
jgi:hypothetical protein